MCYKCFISGHLTFDFWLLTAHSTSLLVPSDYCNTTVLLYRSCHALSFFFLKKCISYLIGQKTCDQKERKKERKKERNQEIDQSINQSINQNHCKNKLVVSTTEWLPWLQRSWRNSGYVLLLAKGNLWNCIQLQRFQAFLHVQSPN